MTDVQFQRRKSLSREEAARWLTALSKGFSDGGEAVLPVGDGGTVTLKLPDEVRAEFEVEVDGNEVEVELEFTWTVGAGSPVDGGNP